MGEAEVTKVNRIVEVKIALYSRSLSVGEKSTLKKKEREIKVKEERYWGDGVTRLKQTS